MLALRRPWSLARQRAFFVGLVTVILPASTTGAEETNRTLSPGAESTVETLTPADAAMAEAAQAARQIRFPKIKHPGGEFEAKVFAAEPLVRNPVAFAFDEQGRVFVAEGHRLPTGVLDNRGRLKWPSEAFVKKASKERMEQIGQEILNAELSARTVADRERLLRTYFEGDLERFTQDSDIVKRVVDDNGDGVADHATVFADGFDRLLDGLMAGVLVRRGQVWVTNIPSLWRLRDANDDGVADAREEVSTGYGVRYAFLGHDLHGLALGPDRRLYFSLGDRGAAVKTKEGKLLSVPDRGAIFRSELDGTRLEIFAEGLRNPQELAFDEFGNLFTADNNSDAGDQARFVYVVERGDSGWRLGYQNLGDPAPRGPWNSEALWRPAFKGQAAYIVPPIANVANGPAGLTYHPGTGHLRAYRQHFFLADFRGQANNSGVLAFSLRPRGAGFHLSKPERFAWGVLATDVDFGPDGAFYVSDWVYGWRGTGKGRLYRVTENGVVSAEASAVGAWLAGSGADRAPEELQRKLAAPDMRVRREAQFALVDARRDDLLLESAQPGQPLLAQLHAIWGLGERLRQTPSARPRPETTTEALVAALIARLEDKRGTPAEEEARAQAAKVLGDAPGDGPVRALTAALSDRTDRVRFFAALALARLRAQNTQDAVVALLARNADRDPFVRHAGILALSAGSRPEELATLAKHRSPSVRLAAAVALRRLGSPLLAGFLADASPLVVREAARAINDVPIEEATPALAALGTGGHRIKDDVVQSRVLHANFRQGTKEGAALLAKVAADRTATEALRQEAVSALGEWTKALPVDRVTGSFRPLPTTRRDPQVASSELRAVLGQILARRQPRVFVTAAQTVAALRIGEAAPFLARALEGTWDDESVRLAALDALATLGAPELARVLPRASADSSPRVRLWALKARVKANPAQGLPLVDETLAKGALAEKQAAVAILGWLHDQGARMRLSTLLDELLANKLEPGLTLDVLEAAAKRREAELDAKLAAFEESRPDTDLGPFAEASIGGDPEEGRKVFLYNTQVQCRRCHSIEGHGSEVGPELLGIGRRRSREYLLEAVVYPSKHFAPGFESVLLTMKDGSIHGGTVKSETPTTLVLDSAEEGVVTVDKLNIADREPGASGMPDGFGSILTKRELRHLVAFLAASR